MTALSAIASLAFLGMLAPPGSILAGESNSVAFFSDIHVGKGEVRHQDLVCIGGTATVEGKVAGDVVVINGKLALSGEANDVVTILSDTRIDPGAVVHGDLVHILGSFTKDSSVTVEGKSVDVGSRLPRGLRRVVSHGLIGLFVLARIISLIISFVVIVLLALLAPARVERMSLALEPRWPASLGFGLLAAIACGVICVGLAITLIGIPLAILLGLVVKLVALMGVAAILMLLGQRVGAGTGFTGPQAPILASVSLGFLLIALVRFVPLVGEVAWMILSILGLGLALVTKLGSPLAGSVPGAPATPAAAGSVS